MHAVYCDATCVACYRNIETAKREALSLRLFYPGSDVFILPA